jgi:hypothetical protein
VEPGAEVRLGNDKLMESVQKVLLIIEYSRGSRVNLVMIRHDVSLINQKAVLKIFEARTLIEVILIPEHSETDMLKGEHLNVVTEKLLCVQPEAVFESFKHNNFLVEFGIFRTFQVKFIRARVFVWLLFVLLMSEAAVLVGSGISSRVIYSKEAAAVSGSFVNEVLLYIKIECKKGMNFEALMPSSNKHLINLTHIYKLPTMSPINFSVKPPVIKSNPSFTS